MEKESEGGRVAHNYLLEGRGEECKALDRPTTAFEPDVLLVEKVEDVEHLPAHQKSISSFLCAWDRRNIHVGRDGAKCGATGGREVLVPCVGDLDWKGGVVDVFESRDEVDGVLELVSTDWDDDSLRTVRGRERLASLPSSFLPASTSNASGNLKECVRVPVARKRAYAV